MSEDKELQVDVLDYEEELLPSEDLDLDSELDVDALDLLDEEDNGPIDSYRSIYTVAPQVILAATSVVKPESSVMNITATVGGGAVTITSNPSIADGINGQVVVLRGSSATDTITITDGNGVQLNGSVTLGLNDTITLYYDGLITNDWIEQSRSLNGTQTGLVLSGTYTPTLANTTNVAASTPRLATYMRVGSAVTVAGQLDIDPTATGAVLLGISLPIASDFTTAYQLGGVASAETIAIESAGIEANATDNNASLKYVAVDTSNHTLAYTFTYTII